MNKKISIKDLFNEATEIFRNNGKVLATIIMIYCLLEILSSHIENPIFSLIILIFSLFISYLFPVIFVKEIKDKNISLNFKTLFNKSLSEFWLSFRIGLIQTGIFSIIGIIFVLPLVILYEKMTKVYSQGIQALFIVTCIIGIIIGFIGILFTGYALQIAINQKLNARDGIKESCKFVKKNFKNILVTYTIIFIFSCLLSVFSHYISKVSSVFSSILLVIPTFYLTIASILIYHKISEETIPFENEI